MADGAVIRTVAEVMSRPALTAEAHESVAVATSRMRDQGVGSVVVIEGDKPIGILTERDLVRFASVGGDAEASAVSEWMTRDPYTFGSGESCVDAFARLSEHGFRHIPVVDEGRLVGVVSIRDLMQAGLRIQSADAHIGSDFP